MQKVQKRLTIPWAQSIVDQHAYGATVSEVSILSIDIGTTTRVRLDIKHDGPSTLPHRWFVKLPSQLQRVKIITALPQLLQTEARFYQKLMHSVPLNCPDVLAIQHSWRQGTLLALADITETGAVPGFPTDALTPDQATLVIEQLAHLHAYFGMQEISVLLKTGYLVQCDAGKIALETFVCAIDASRTISRRRNCSQNATCSCLALCHPAMQSSAVPFECSPHSRAP